MDIPHQTLHRIWSLSIAGDADALAEKERLHAAHPELDRRFTDFSRALARMKSGKKKKKKPAHKFVPTVWTKAQERFLTSTNGNAIPVSGGATGLKR